MNYQDQHVAQVRKRELQRQTWCWWCISGSFPGLGSSQRLSIEILLEMQPGIKVASTLGKSWRKDIQPD